jgi:hypothetical protein
MLIYIQIMDYQTHSGRRQAWALLLIVSAAQRSCLRLSLWWLVPIKTYNSRLILVPIKTYNSRLILVPIKTYNSRLILVLFMLPTWCIVCELDEKRWNTSHANLNRSQGVHKINILTMQKSCLPIPFINMIKIKCIYSLFNIYILNLFCQHASFYISVQKHLSWTIVFFYNPWVQLFFLM